MNSERTRLGLKAAKDGDRREARRIFAAIVREAPDDLMGWWHLANVTDDSEQKAGCLRQVLRIDPGHVAARAMLTEAEQQVARQTPARGFSRPVADADATGEVSRPSMVQLPPVSADKPRATAPLLAAVAVIAVVLTTALVVVMRLPAEPPKPTPTTAPARGLALTVQECVTSSGPSASLTFINQSGHAVYLFKGAAGQEVTLGTLANDTQLVVDATPGEQVRYSARADDDATLTGGASIEVPAGNSCTVPIK